MKNGRPSPPSCKSCSKKGVQGSPIWCSKWGCNAHTACKKVQRKSAHGGRNKLSLSSQVVGTRGVFSPLSRRQVRPFRRSIPTRLTRRDSLEHNYFLSVSGTERITQRRSFHGNDDVTPIASLQIAMVISGTGYSYTIPLRLSP